MSHLKRFYPSLYICVLQHLKRKDLLDKYMQECKEYINDSKKYSLFIHGYLIPWVDQQRADGKLK